MTAGVVCQCLHPAKLTDHPDTCSSVCWDHAGLVTAFMRTCASSCWALPAWSNRVRCPATSASRASACSSGNGQTTHLSCSPVIVLVCAWRLAKACSPGVPEGAAGAGHQLLLSLPRTLPPCTQFSYEL